MRLKGGNADKADKQNQSFIRYRSGSISSIGLSSWLRLNLAIAASMNFLLK